MKRILLLVLLFISVSVFSQEEAETDSVFIEKSKKELIELKTIYHANKNIEFYPAYIEEVLVFRSNRGMPYYDLDLMWIYKEQK